MMLNFSVWLTIFVIIGVILIAILTGKVGGDFELVVRAVLENKPLSDDKGYVCETEEQKFIEAYKTFLGGLELTCESHAREAERFNEVFYWYLHNAFIHYAVPHGLEQSGGAAWGTENCQGMMGRDFSIKKN